jgi:hydrogenase nickel incorporation protein HypA/HybF
MHELSLAQSLVERVEAEAAKAALLKVTRVEASLGSLLGVEKDLFEEAFAISARGARCEGARLELRAEGAEARCRACGERYEPEWQDFQCPACGLAEPEILKGRDLFLYALSGEQAN